jgi:signal transduction histidine kinase
LVFCNELYRTYAQYLSHLFEPGVRYETLLRATVENGVIDFPGDDAESKVQARLARHRDPAGAFEVHYSDGRWMLIAERRTRDGGIVLVQTDISELKQNEMARRKAQTLLVDAIESLPMSFVIYDADDRVVMANDMYEQTFPALKGHMKPGTSARELFRRNLDAALFPEADGNEDEWLEKRLSEFHDGTPFSELHLRDGRVLRAMERPTSEGGTVSIRVDITEQSKTEQALVEAKEAAESANRAKSEFLSSMSHELRTPLNAILGFAQLLRDYSDTPLSQEQTASVEQIVDAGQHLLALVSEILDLAKVEAVGLDMSMQPMALAQTIQESLAVVKPLADKSGVSLMVSAEVSARMLVQADPGRLKQILLNLLSNAVKYNREKGTVTVAATTTDTGMLRVSITDTGLGIPAEKHNEVFRPFSRLGLEASKIEGTGIGLTISRQLVENMGGRLDFDSRLGEGSTFWFELPSNPEGL